jgi:amino acid transporter
LFAATIAAATLGNMIFHFFRDYRYVAEMGLWQALVGFQVYAFYATVLGLGIGFSQLRSHGRERSRGEWRWWRRATATVGVLFFFCLLEIFDQEGRSYGLGPYWHFFLRLFLIPA